MKLHIENTYIDLKNTKISNNEIKLTLTKDGLKYGETRKGAKNLAVYATTKYKQIQQKEFSRPIENSWNSVANEIYDHCRWALGKGFGKIPFVKMRANPINIRIKDKPPLWH